MRNKKGQFKKGGHRRKRRRSNPAPARAENPAPRRRRRRRANPAPARRRRRNPGGYLGTQSFAVGQFPIKSLIPYVLATLAQSYVVRKWGDSWGVGMLGPQQLPGSGYRGQAWTLKNYLIAGLTGFLGAKLLGRTKMGAGWANIWWQASIQGIATRLVWTEMIARSTWGQANFGATGMPGAGQPGQVYQDGRGNQWLMSQNGQWVSMQGAGYGELVQAGPLGGYGELVQAGPLGRYAGGYQPLGGLMAADSSRAEVERAEALGLGSTDPYLAAIQRAA